VSTIATDMHMLGLPLDLDGMHRAVVAALAPKQPNSLELVAQVLDEELTRYKYAPLDDEQRAALADPAQAFDMVDDIECRVLGRFSRDSVLPTLLAILTDVHGARPEVAA
jgi:hypothetical protein